MDLPPFDLPPSDPPPFDRFVQHAEQLRHDTRGSLAERWALIAGSIAVACVVSANLAATAAKRGLLPEIVWHTGAGPQVAERAPPSRVPGAIDYTVTASIASPSAVTRLDPCTGKEK